MAENEAPNNIWNEAFGSSEVFSCEPCFNVGTGKDAIAFCDSCETYLCKQCAYKHQRKFQSHKVIDENGHALFDTAGPVYLSRGSSGVEDIDYIVNRSERTIKDRTNENGCGVDVDYPVPVPYVSRERSESQSTCRRSEHCLSDDSNTRHVFPRDTRQADNQLLKVDSKTYVIRKVDKMRASEEGAISRRRPEGEVLQCSAGELATDTYNDVNTSFSHSLKIDSPTFSSRLKMHCDIANRHFDHFSLMSEVNVSVNKEFCVSSTAMLSEETIVVVQENRNNLLVFNIAPDKRKIKVSINFEKKPAYVASVRQNEFVVTFPKEHVVRFVKFVEQTFNVGKAIYVHGECSGISMLWKTGNMLIAYPFLRELKILTHTGQVVTSVSTQSVGLIFRPINLAVYGDNFFLVDQSTNCILKCVLVGGKLNILNTTFLDKCLRGMPTDITTSSDGDLFVSVSICDVIYRLSCKTMEIKSQYDNKHGLYRPSCICSLLGKLTVLEHKLASGSLDIKIYNI